MAEIFISYSQKDKAKVRLIAESLEREGLDVFWDPEIPPGETWDNVIARELKAARCVIVAWSEASAESDWVKEEADFGKRMKALVPVQIDPSGPPLGFSRIQTANLSDWTGDPAHGEWRKVLDRVRHHGVDTGTVDPAPPAEPRQAGRLRDALYENAPQAAPSQAQPSSFQYSGGGSQPAASAGAGAGAAAFASTPAGPSGAKDPVTEFDFQYAFFKPKGRMTKKPFWIGFAIFFVASILIGLVPIVGPLLMIFPGICLYGKRLHDFGQSAWLYGGLQIFGFMLGMIGGVAAESGSMDPAGLLGLIGFMFLVNIGFTLWVGLTDTEPRPNKHGPVPGTRRKYDEAKSLCERAIMIVEKAHGAELQDLAKPLNNLAGLLQLQGKYDEAKRHYERAIAITENTLGAEHPGFGISLYNFAGLLSRQGDINEAILLLGRALSIFQASLGTDHPYTQMVASALMKIPEIMNSN
ncbi:MAG: tetratricopeptide repeat protein [Pseudomonadota bacterium]